MFAALSAFESDDPAAPDERAWSDRALDTALSPERLAALIARTEDRFEGLLFTATPAEELDDIGRWQRLADLAWVGQVRAVVASYNRATARDREFVPDEAALALRVSPMTGAGITAEALQAAELPGLLEAVDAGVLTVRHVKAVLRELAAVDLTLEQRQAVVLVLLARYRGELPGQLSALTRRLILTVDRAAARAREERARRSRRVRFLPGVDGQASIWAQGPAAMIAAIQASLEATLPLEIGGGDERSTDERTFDLFVDLLTGGAAAGTWTASVIVPFSTLDGGDLELAEIPGLGPALPETARDLVDQCTAATQISVDAGTGQVLCVSDPIPVGAADHRTRHTSLAREPGRAARAAGPRHRELPDPRATASPRRGPGSDLRVSRLPAPSRAHRSRPRPPLAPRADRRGQPALPLPSPPPRQAGRLPGPTRA